MDERKSPLIWIGGLVAAVALVLGLWALRGDDADEADDARAAEHAGNPFAAAKPKPPTLGRDLARADKAAVSGTIRDPEGQPIAGARVCGFAQRSQLRGLGDDRPRCTLSEADGHYRLEGLWPVRTTIEVSAAGFIPGRWQARDEHGHLRELLSLSPGRTAEGIDVVLRPGGVLVSGEVRDISGGEIEGALVVAEGRRSIQRGLAVAETDETGRFELWTAPGSLTLTALAEGYADGEVIAVAPGAFVELFLTPESVLVGRVVDAQSKQPLADVTVSVSAGRRFRGREHATRTDDAGNFRIDRLEPGIYKPVAESDQVYGEAAEQVHLGLGETSEPVEILAYPAFFVSGIVSIAGSDRACPEGSVSLRADGRTQRASIGDEGLVELRGVFPGEYQVEVRCEGYLSEDSYPTVEVVDQSLDKLSWEVREGLAIRGEVVAADGTPLAEVSVLASMVVGGEDARARRTNDRTRTGEDGHFELLGLLPGRYELHAGRTFGGGRPGPEQPVVVELEGGANVNDLRIVMPAVGELRGRLIDTRGQPVAGATIRAEAIGRNEAQFAQTNDAGEFSFDDLRPGQTRVSAAGSSRFAGAALRTPGTTDDDPQGEVVEILADEIVELELVVEASEGVIRGVVLDEGGSPVADAFVDAERISERAAANASRTRAALRWSWNRKPVLTDHDGRFELDELPEGRFVVRAHRKGGGEAVVEDVELGADIELVIAATGELGGTVVDPGGRPPERFRVVVRDRAQGIGVGDEFFRTEGKWALRELPPGSYQISASTTAGTAELDVELDEGERRTDLVLELDSHVTIRGRIVDLETGEPLPGFEVNAAGRGGMRRIRPNAGDERSNVTGEDGRFELSQVPSGRTRIIARPRTGGSDRPYDFAFVVKDIPPEPAVQDIGDIEAIARRVERGKQPGDLGFEIKELDPATPPEDVQVIVALVRPGSPAAAAGLEVGAVIERVDGHAIDGDINRYLMLTAVPPGRTIALGLAQGGTVEITAAPPR